MRALHKALRPPQLGGDSLRASDWTAMNTVKVEVEAAFGIRNVRETSLRHVHAS